MTSTGDISNDTRGWILCVISAVACVAGACIVCVDVFVRLLPGKKNFSIQDSSAFLSASLSLSFGVMIFSSLFSMLPSSKRYLLKDGHGEQAAGLLMMGSFAAGFVGMQVISRIIHRFMPSHVVDCAHSHGDDACLHGESLSSPDSHEPATETAPLLTAARPVHPLTNARRPSMVEIQNRVLSFVRDVKLNCDESGSCFGYTEPCGQECKRVVRLPAGGVVAEAAEAEAAEEAAEATEAAEVAEEAETDDPEPYSAGASSTVSYGTTTEDCHHAHQGHDHSRSRPDIESGDHIESDHHHHHVPANAFLSIGLQTVLAIGLHKFPEGFITFATNHANPALGFNVFTALFVHNIAEGFAMALPLYMALGSRLKAILWAAALGGLSQPLGAGVAALWLRYLARGDRGGETTDELGTAYGVLFAVTAGIMVAVALQLFVESLTLHHNRQLTVGFAFVGMMMLGLSNAIGH